MTGGAQQMSPHELSREHGPAVLAICCMSLFIVNGAHLL
jgi:hypothetical protein